MNLSKERESSLRIMRMAFKAMPDDLLSLVADVIKEEIASRPAPTSHEITMDLTRESELPKGAHCELTIAVEPTINSLTLHAQRWAASFSDDVLQSLLEHFGEMHEDLDAAIVEEGLTTWVVGLFTRALRDECDRRVKAVKV